VYRFLSNRRVQEGRILAVHFQATWEGAATADGLLLILHDSVVLKQARTRSTVQGAVFCIVSWRIFWMTMMN